MRHMRKRHDLLPHLRHMTAQILTELKTRWVDVKPLELYRAFHVDLDINPSFKIPKERSSVVEK